MLLNTNEPVTARPQIDRNKNQNPKETQTVTLKSAAGTRKPGIKFVLLQFKCSGLKVSVRFGEMPEIRFGLKH